MIEPRSGKIPTTSVRRRISRFSRSLGLFDQIWRHRPRGNWVKARISGGVEVGLDLREPDDVVEELFVLGVHGGGADLVEHRVQHRLDPAPGVLGTDRHQVRGVVGSTPLPGRTRECGSDRVDQSGVGVAGHQGDPGRAAGDQVLEEGVPAGA